MIEAVPRPLVEAFYKAYATRDAKQIAPFIDDDVEWTISGPVGILPFCGTRHGKAAVLDLIGRLVPETFRVVSIVPSAMLIDGDRVATLNRVLATRRGDGRAISYRLSHFIRFHDGKVIENVSLIDSFDAAEQVLGHPLALSEAHAAGNRVGV